MSCVARGAVAVTEENDREEARDASTGEPVGELLVVPAARARFRVEPHGGFAHQPLSSVIERLWPFDMKVLALLDGQRTVREVEALLSADPDAPQPVLAHFRHAIRRLARVGAVRVSRVRLGGRHRAFEQIGAPLARDAPHLSAPTLVFWEPSQRCNLKCDYCYTMSGPLESDGIERERVAANIIAAGTCHVLMVGGEPMMMPDFAERIAQFENAGVSVQVVTNGWYLNDKGVAELEASRVTSVTVSLDGDEPTHDRVRGRKGSFRRAVEGVRALVARGFDVTVLQVVQQSNFHSMEALIDLAAEAGAQSIRLNPLVAAGRALQIVGDPGLTPPQLAECWRLVTAKDAALTATVEMVNDEFDRCACGRERSNRECNAPAVARCVVPRYACYVRADGLVAPTPGHRERVVGSIVDRTLAEVWRDEAAWESAKAPVPSSLQASPELTSEAP